MIKTMAVVVFAALNFATVAAAQDQWGVSVGLTPSWQTGGGSRFLLKADRVDLHGSEIRLGFVRGSVFEGDWGMSFIDKAIDENSTLDVDVTSCGRGDCGTFYRTLTTTRMTGLEVHEYRPFKTWRDRVQLGMVGAVGVAWMRGNVYRRTTSDLSDIESFDADAGELFPPSRSVVPLVRLEIAGSGIIAEGLKIRASGGFSMPGYHRFGVTFMYIFPER
jgi:hypothetical protein